MNEHPGQPSTAGSMSVRDFVIDIAAGFTAVSTVTVSGMTAWLQLPMGDEPAHAAIFISSAAIATLLVFTRLKSFLRSRIRR